MRIIYSGRLCASCWVGTVSWAVMCGWVDRPPIFGKRRTLRPTILPPAIINGQFLVEGPCLTETYPLTRALLYSACPTRPKDDSGANTLCCPAGFIVVDSDSIKVLTLALLAFLPCWLLSGHAMIMSSSMSGLSHP